MQWEYRIGHIYAFDEEPRERATSTLNELGDAGWEAIAVWEDNQTDTCALLKRQK